MALAPSRTILAQEGAALESEGSEPAGRVVHCCVSPPLLNLPSAPVKGEAGRWGREGAGNMGGQAGPSQRESERGARSSHHEV